MFCAIFRIKLWFGNQSELSQGCLFPTLADEVYSDNLRFCHEWNLELPLFSYVSVFMLLFSELSKSQGSWTSTERISGNRGLLLILEAVAFRVRCSFTFGHVHKLFGNWHKTSVHFIHSTDIQPPIFLFMFILTKICFKLLGDKH